MIGKSGVCLPRTRGRGRRRAISTSKIRKTTARRKKRREKGIRAVSLGSKPHSKGVAVSRRRFIFIARKWAASLKSVQRKSVARSM